MMSSFCSLSAEILYQVFYYVTKGDDLVVLLGVFRTKSGDSTVECVLRDRDFRFSQRYSFHNCYLIARDLEFNNHVILRTIMPINRCSCWIDCDCRINMILIRLKNLIANGVHFSEMSLACREEIFTLALFQSNHTMIRVVHYLLTEHANDFAEIDLLHRKDQAGWIRKAQESALRSGYLKVFQWLHFHYSIDVHDDRQTMRMLQNAIFSGSLDAMKYVVGLGVSEWVMIHSRYQGHLLIIESLLNQDNNIFEFLLGLLKLNPYPEMYFNRLLEGVCGPHGSFERFQLLVTSFSIGRYYFVPSEENHIVEIVCRNARLDILQYIVKRFDVGRKEVTHWSVSKKIGRSLGANKINREEMMQLLCIKENE